MFQKAQDIIKFVLVKFQLVDSEENELDLEALMLWVFLLITAFRAFFANANITLGHLNWTVPDSNIAVSLPVLYSLLSNSHRRYLKSKDSTNVENTSQKSS